MLSIKKMLCLLCLGLLFSAALPEIALCDKGMDVVFVLDRSGSMRARTAGPGSPSRMELAVRAIELFVIGMHGNDSIGISVFTWDTAFSKALSSVTDETFEQFKESIYDQVVAVQQGGYTDILLGLRNGVEMLKGMQPNPERRKIFVLLTDGKMESQSAATMEERYGPGTGQYFGEAWRPLVARDTAWLVENEIPVHVILLGSERDANEGRIDRQFASLVAALSHGSLHWARSADDLRPIYQRLWHQLANRPIPKYEAMGNAIKVTLGERISEMQVVLSEKRRPDITNPQHESRMEARFFHNNVQVTAESMPNVSLNLRRGFHALAYTLTNPPPGVWKIEPEGLDVDIWVDVGTWWRLEPRVLGTEGDELDIAQPFRFEIAVLDKGSDKPIDDPSIIAGMSAIGMVSPTTDSSLKLHAGGTAPLGWDSERKAFTGYLFTKDGTSSNVEGAFNALCKVQFSETQETAPHTLVVRQLPPTGNLTVFPERIVAYGLQGARAPLAGKSVDANLVNPTLHLQASKSMTADVVITFSDFTNKASGKTISSSLVRGGRSCRLSAGGTAELAFELDVPGDVPDGIYEGLVSITSSTPNITGTEIPVTLEIGGHGLREVTLINPAIDPTHNVRILQERKASEFLLRGITTGQITPRAILEAYRISAKLVSPDGTASEYSPIPQALAAGSHAPEWTLDIPARAPGKYRLDISARHSSQKDSMEFSFDVYVHPNVSSKMISGGLGGLPARFEAAINPDELAHVSDFKTWIVLTSPDRRERKLPLADDGTKGDILAGDGIYTGTTLLPVNQLGRWTWKDFHSFALADTRFEIDPEQELMVEAGLWIDGADISRRDPSVLSLAGRITRMGRKVDIKVSTTNLEWDPVTVEIGEVRTLGTSPAAGTMPKVTITSGENRTRATEPFQGKVLFEIQNSTASGTYLVPVTITIGNTRPQTAMLEFQVWRVPLWLWAALAVLLLFVYVVIIVPLVWKIKLASFKGVMIIAGDGLNEESQSFAKCCRHGRWKSLRKLFGLTPFATFATSGSDIEVAGADAQGRLQASGGLLVTAHTKLAIVDSAAGQEKQELEAGAQTVLRTDGQVHIELVDRNGGIIGQLKATEPGCNDEAGLTI
ncbi:MAG: VWA domain-containing protein [Deltaproteobacteria bacterium]|nr:VWA domain-containing protein [Deltaproteobacteria bacterium]